MNQALATANGHDNAGVAAALHCANCGSERMSVFYEVRRVPVHSCQLVPNSLQAKRFPAGDIRLAHCAGCGFLSNVLYNGELLDYANDYEESQHCSSHFNAFARMIARRWVEDYAIYDKTILDIGCGKGEFLDIFTEIGHSVGIGIDPGCDPSRVSAAGRQRLRFIADTFSSEYGALQPDVICCRHTLEHIFPTDAFVKELRKAIGDKRDTLVLFELPDTSRILKERAFWDIYYEHCSYFTAGSLARLFRRNGFDVVDLSLEYDDQYLVLAARPSDGPTRPRFALEDDLEQTESDVAAFMATCPHQIRSWQDKVRAFARDGRRVALWGSGSKCVSFCTTLGVSDELSYVVDINPRLNGKFLAGTGYPIVEPAYLSQCPPDVVIAMNPVYRDEIQADLDRLGIGAELLTL